MVKIISDFNFDEKLSFIKVIENMIHADCKVEQEELMYFEQLKKRLSFTNDFVEEAKRLDTMKCVEILKLMSNSKKQIVYDSLVELANVDDEFHPNEKVLIDNLCQLIHFKPQANSWRSS
ncbi:TerB family tellurite resistance protein [Flammeovirga yaeyamensis]|uniref:TerB family tellurite resistance protein n=1 Tax=Flammeovirga yaeyamensis TaxID=367791 RepID=A0AAX1NAY5_9BACT|nr:MULTISPECIES: TerB family tellurite resistance protein [Flammeovirga]ANQ52419.1 TerB family tellurite resistance protein [Flammeovirga sp. MY04]MBB3699891.1 putative tellurite resistance protein B-like protein [Flammeovirga yaeyamensis]NMF38313.1 TerB family tellurite resistance protein [Flammeovirga yaeyamensis]QWG04725.1 TerB family tellurite resistance protein [Flammeovirga yaeyamensis]